MHPIIDILHAFLPLTCILTRTIVVTSDCNIVNAIDGLDGTAFSINAIQ